MSASRWGCDRLFTQRVALLGRVCMSSNVTAWKHCNVTFLIVFHVFLCLWHNLDSLCQLFHFLCIPIQRQSLLS